MKLNDTNYANLLKRRADVCREIITQINKKKSLLEKTWTAVRSFVNRIKQKVAIVTNTLKDLKNWWRNTTIDRRELDCWLIECNNRLFLILTSYISCYDCSLFLQALRLVQQHAIKLLEYDQMRYDFAAFSYEQFFDDYCESIKEDYQIRSI